MILQLKRLIESDKSTIGKLTINNDNSYDTIELPKSDVRRIPNGLYDMILSYSPKFNCMRWLIDVPNREGIRIHSANKASELEGCVALGTYDPNTIDYISNSRITLDKFEISLYLMLIKDRTRLQINITN